MMGQCLRVSKNKLTLAQLGATAGARQRAHREAKQTVTTDAYWQFFFAQNKVLVFVFFNKKGHASVYKLKMK